MPRESWLDHYRGKTSDDKEKKSSPRTEPDARSGSSERPHAAEPETEPGHEDARERETGSREGTREFGDLFKDLLKNPELAKMDNMAKKKKLKELLREEKYKAQGSDYKRVEAITKKGKPTPWRTNTEWNKINKTGREGKPIMRFWRPEKEYRTAWRDLWRWAQENGVWKSNDKREFINLINNKREFVNEERKLGNDERELVNDEREFIKETGGRPWTRWGTKWETAWKTTRNVGLNVAVGGLYGVGYALVAPWKGFELGLKYASVLTGDEKYTQGMMEEMFSKKKERQVKGKEIKENWNKAKEYDVRKKVKENERNYLQGLRGQITDQKIESIIASPEYIAATGDDRARFDKEITDAQDGLYKKAWRRMRTYWIQEKMWGGEDEKKFREELGYTEETKIEDVRKDFLTRSEWNEVKSLRGETRKKEASQEKQTEGSQKWKELDQEIKENKINIKEILDKSEERLKKGMWPFNEEGQGKGRRQERSYENSAADTESDEDDDEEDNQT